jgi:2-keto-4-pentenoate hydratase/2-oxohepta-3-ene-1,7-dioic acid hydratase in catechol pathway
VSIARFGRFELAGGITTWARIEGDVLHELTDAPWRGGHDAGRTGSLATARRLCPVEPRQIYAIGRNYRAHAKEMGAEVPTSPLLFLKAVSSLLDPGGTVLLPPESSRVEHEAELGVVIGMGGRRIPESEAMAHVFGYTCVGDLTARDLQKADGQWSRAKGFDTFCPVGPEVVTGIDPGALTVRAIVNGVVRQDGNTRDLIFPIARLVSHLSQAMTLEPGDLIATGTPEGVGPLNDGDRLIVEVEQVGKLEVRVSREVRPFDSAGPSGPRRSG